MTRKLIPDLGKGGLSSVNGTKCTSAWNVMIVAGEHEAGPGSRESRE